MKYNTCYARDREEGVEGRSLPCNFSTLLYVIIIIIATTATQTTNSY